VAACVGVRAASKDLRFQSGCARLGCARSGSIPGALGLWHVESRATHAVYGRRGEGGEEWVEERSERGAAVARGRREKGRRQGSSGAMGGGEFPAEGGSSAKKKGRTDTWAVLGHLFVLLWPNLDGGLARRSLTP
jgi:hypothetical protein